MWVPSRAVWRSSCRMCSYFCCSRVWDLKELSGFLPRCISTASSLQWISHVGKVACLWEILWRDDEESGLQKMVQPDRIHHVRFGFDSSHLLMMFVLQKDESPQPPENTPWYIPNVCSVCVPDKLVSSCICLPAAEGWAAALHSLQYGQGCSETQLLTGRVPRTECFSGS